MRQHRSHLVSFISLVIAGYPRRNTSCAFTVHRLRCGSAECSMTSTSLLMAKGGIHGKKTRMLKAGQKKKKKNPNSPGKHRKTSKRDNTAEGTSKASKQQPPSPSSSTKKPKLSILRDAKKAGGPPWQVMGEKDAKKHVAAEKARRERIKLEIQTPSAESANEKMQKADVSQANRLISTADRAMLSWKRFNPSSGPSDLTMVGAYLNKELPPSLGVPEVAFLGRSNVGKSSLLNRLVSKAGGDTARVGKTPGATASVNLYALMGQPKRGEAKPILGFADLPGFGYAKLSHETKASVEEAAERYLGKRRELALGVLLVDSRRVPTADDRAVLAALFDMGVPLIVAATKSDKLKARELESAMATIRDGLGLPDGQPLQVSGVTGEGIKDIWRIILEACETRVEELKLAMEEGRDDGGSMRVLLDEKGQPDDWYNEDFDEEEDEGFEDGEELFYDQGYDWVQGEEELEEGGDFYDSDSFYDGDDMIGDENEDENWNEEQQRIEKESFKLKNLNMRVDEMEIRGEI